MTTNDNKAAGQKRTITDQLRSLGPGIITAALVFGPSKITITSKLGAEYGFSLLWIVVFTIFFMMVFTSMAARIGIANDRSLLGVIREKWGKKASVALGFGVFLVTASFQAGNSIGIGISLSELTHTPPVRWIVIFNFIGICLLFFRAFYKVLEKIMILLIGLMLTAFVTTLILVKPPVSGLASGLIPSVPPGSSGLGIAFVASCFSIVGAFYQSYLVQERRRVNPRVRQSGNDSFPGIIVLGIMSAIVLTCAATVLYPKGIRVTSATDMAKALEPLFGKYASVLFLCGLFGASFSALIGNASVGGTLLGDALGYGGQLNAKSVRYLIALIMIIGATVAIVFGKLPLELLIFAQRVTIFIVPFIGIAMYSVANDSGRMGTLTNSRTAKISGALGLAVIIVLALMSVRDMIFK
ncbi:Nramp family divalent metal transporter [Flavitalea flava]